MTVRYSRHMIEVVRTDDFDKWLTKLKDRAGRLRILKRIDRLAGGDKSTQQNDIDKAHRLADEWRSDMKEAGDDRNE